MTESGIEQRVHPAMVPKHSAIAEVSGVTNCVAIDGDFCGNLLLAGAGAGAKADGFGGRRRHRRHRPRRQSAAVRRAGRQASSPTSAPSSASTRAPTTCASPCIDRPGAMAGIAGRMGERERVAREHRAARPRGAQLGIAARPKPGAPTPVILITHETTEEAMRGALDTDRAKTAMCPSARR